MLSFFLVSLQYASSQKILPCNSGCLSHSIGDNSCYLRCMSLGCNYDSPVYSDDIYTTFQSSDCFSSCPCDKEKLTNGVCDAQCDIYQCGFDLGDCGYCDSGCFVDDLLSDTCNGNCYAFECWFYDSNKCIGTCADGCTLENMNSYPCREECKSKECMRFTHNTCTVDYCSYMCQRIFIGDKVCQAQCYNPECSFDNGDCSCSIDCLDTSGECLTTETYHDPCDTNSCSYKDGKCGYCASGCFKQHLGDGICQLECNTKSCNYDQGDCGCAPGCSFIYDPLYSAYINIGFSSRCSSECLVLDCQFGIHFCNNFYSVKLAIMNFLVYKDKDKVFNLEECKCDLDSFSKYLERQDKCERNSTCNTKECFYCLGQTNKYFNNCTINSFDQCLVCTTTMVEGICYEDLTECPHGYEIKYALSFFFATRQWCLKEAVHYSSSYYNEIVVNSSVITNENQVTENIVNSLYGALVQVYASYTKIYLVDKEIDFFIDGSSSVFVTDAYDPLNITTAYESYELWIIGNFSENEKTIVYLKDNLKISPRAQRFYLKNIEFIGKYVLNKTCEYETCFYCPIVNYNKGVYKDDSGVIIEDSKYLNQYSKNCSDYSSVNVFNFKNEAYIESVSFVEFRYQFNSFIKSSGILSLKNVDFTKMQSKSDGSIIMFQCTEDCIESSFTYNQGLVIDLGAGYHYSSDVKTGSFFTSSNIGNVLIVNVTFSFNFVFNNFRSSIKTYLIYSKNHLGTINIENCEFSNIFVNYLIYIDVSSLVYTDYRRRNGESLVYSQQHFYMNNNKIMYTCCSIGMISYLMSNVVHNIKIVNMIVENSIVGKNGALRFVNEGSITEADIKGEYDNIPYEFDAQYIWIKPRLIYLDNITFKMSNIGKNVLYIEQFPNIELKNFLITNIQDSSIDEIIALIKLFRINDENRYISTIYTGLDYSYLNCSESVLIQNSANLIIDSMHISNNICNWNNSTLGLSLKNLFMSTNIKKLLLQHLSGETNSGVALAVTDSNLVNFNDLYIYNVESLGESVLKFDNCKTISLDLVQIIQVKSKFISAFLVTNTNAFTLSNFLLNQITTEFNNGGCMLFQTSNKNSLFKLKSGTFNLCNSANGKGGAIFLDSKSKVPFTSLEMNDVNFFNCSSDEGSAIYITNYVKFYVKPNKSKLMNIRIKDSYSSSGGVISDYHLSGTLEIDDLEIDNCTKGIYIFYSDDTADLRILNSKIYGSKISKSVVYLSSSVLWPSVYFLNIEIYKAKDYAIEAYYFKMTLEGIKIIDSNQAFYISDQVDLEANRLVVTNSMGKAISLSKNCYFYCNNCEFYNNSNSIFEASTFSNFILVDSKIFSNNLKSGYLIYLSLAETQKSSMINTTVYYNTLNSGSLIYLASSTLSIKDCCIIDNKGYSFEMKAIYLYDSILNINNSKFHFNSLVLNGALIYAEAGSYVIAENCTFVNSSSRLGNIFGKNINIKLNKCRFSGNTGGDIYLEQSNFILNNSLIENSVLSSENSGVVSLKNKFIAVIEGTSFRNVSVMQNLKYLAYVYNELGNQLNITDCTMKGSNDSVMAVYSQESELLIIKNSNFYQFKASDYSALTMVSNIEECMAYIIDSKITDNLSAKSGGGVYSESYNLIIENTEISFNSASNSGGGIYYTTHNCDNCGIYLLGNTRIFNNSCENDGGAIKWENYKPFIDNSVLIYNNSAVYGADFASKPARFGLPETRRLSDTIITTITNIPPAKKFNGTILIYIYDTYGQVVETENSLTVTLFANETLDSIISVSGITTFKAENGVISISDFILTGKPGSSAYIKIKSDNMIEAGARNDETQYMDSAIIKVEFRNCSRGEQIQASACVDCAKYKYTLKASENCLDCPAGASCPGGKFIIVKNGYWRSSLESDVIYVCDVFDACLKGNENNELGNCNTGYSGVLCKSCEIGYSRIANSVCTKCPSKKTNFLTLSLLILSIIFLSFVLVKTTLTSAFSPKALHSIYIKIFTNYLQLIFIITQFDLEWPSYVMEFFKIQRSASSISDQIFSLDCYISLKNSGDIKNVYYIKLCIITSLPLVITLLSYIYWIFYSFIVESYKCLKREVFTTIVVLFFLVYPTIVKVMFSNFSCIDIDKMNSYLNENTLIECWDSKHKKFSFIVVIPSIILWVIGIPTILLLLMTKNRRRLHLDYYRVVYGFLYNGYKQSRY